MRKRDHLAVVTFVKTHFGFLAQSLNHKRVQFVNEKNRPSGASGGASSAVSGVQIFNDEGEDGMRAILVGQISEIRRHVEGLGGCVPNAIALRQESISKAGDASLVVCDGRTVLGLIHFYKSQQCAISSVFASLQRLGFEVISTPSSPTGLPNCENIDAEKKLLLVKMLQSQNKRVAYIGQCPSDRPALAQSELKLVAKPTLDLLTGCSDATNIRGEHIHFKHLFRLGRELRKLRRDLRFLQLNTTGASVAVSAALTYLRFDSISPWSYGRIGAK